jgi:hypothetical protein
MGIMTSLIDIFLGVDHFGIKNLTSLGIIVEKAMALGQDNQFLTGNVVLLDGLPNKNFRKTLTLSTASFGVYVGVDIGSIPSLNSCIPGSFEQRQCLSFIQNPVSPCICSVGHTSKD